MAIRDLITSDPYYQNLVNPRGFPTGNDPYVSPTFDDPEPQLIQEPEFGIQSIINQFQGGSDRGGMPTSTSGLIGDFMTATQNRTNNLTNPNKFQGMLNSGMEMFGITPQRDIGEMIRSGQVDMRNTSGIPLGIGSAIGRMLPDKYNDMSLSDQVFTQSQMGYDGPTVFGENSMGNKDPFGLNVRSGFGNYGEAVAGNFNQLRDTLTKDRDGVTFNEETGMFEGLNADAVNKNTKMIRDKYLFRQKQLGVKNNLDAMIKESSQNRKIKAAEAAKIYKEKLAADAITMAANTKNQDGSTAAYNYAGRDNKQGTHTSTISNQQAQTNQDRGRGQQYSSPAKSAPSRSSSYSSSRGSNFGGRFHGADGGRVGLASMFTRRR